MRGRGGEGSRGRGVEGGAEWQSGKGVEWLRGREGERVRRGGAMDSGAGGLGVASKSTVMGW